MLEAIRLLDLQVDVIHANDWQTGLVPAYLKSSIAAFRRYEQIASLFTIHNMAYQGQFWHWDMLLTGLDWKYFNWRQMEFYGNLNLLKTGLVFADAINTVSPRYAEEIQTPDFGCGLEGVLQHRHDVLSGILNGMDYRALEPGRRSAPGGQLRRRHGSAKASRSARRPCSESWACPSEPDVPLVGLIGRLADQKGFDLVAEVMQRGPRKPIVQWVILGTGEPKYHEQLSALAERYPDRVAVRLEFSDALAHQIEAGADMFLMPSRYEPCGLNQMYSLAYGTVPVVRATGGLADTITDADEQTLADGTANGFSFREYSEAAFSEALRRACDMYCDKIALEPVDRYGHASGLVLGRQRQAVREAYEATVARKNQAIHA